MSLETCIYGNIRVSLCVACLEKEAEEKVSSVKTRIEFTIYKLITLGPLHIIAAASAHLQSGDDNPLPSQAKMGFKYQEFWKPLSTPKIFNFCIHF